MNQKHVKAFFKNCFSNPFINFIKRDYFSIIQFPSLDSFLLSFNRAVFKHILGLQSHHFLFRVIEVGYRFLILKLFRRTPHRTTFSNRFKTIPR